MGGSNIRLVASAVTEPSGEPIQHDERLAGQQARRREPPNQRGTWADRFGLQAKSASQPACSQVETCMTNLPGYRPEDEANAAQQARRPTLSAAAWFVLLSRNPGATK